MYVMGRADDDVHTYIYIQRVEDLNLQVTRKDEAMEREKEARRRLNDMLQGYKDEVGR